MANVKLISSEEYSLALYVDDVKRVDYDDMCFSHVFLILNDYLPIESFEEFVISEETYERLDGVLPDHFSSYQTDDLE